MYFMLVLINKLAILRGQNYHNNVLSGFDFLQHSSKQSSTVDLKNWHRYSFIVIILETREEDIKKCNEVTLNTLRLWVKNNNMKRIARLKLSFFP